MTAESYILDQRPFVRLGCSDAPLRFVDGGNVPDRAPGGRYLTLDGELAFELSFWCGTCPFLFERLYGANHALSLDVLQECLNEGLSCVDNDVIKCVSALLSRGEYLPILEELPPRLVMPMQAGDYFSEDQDNDGFWGLPHYPRTPYYRSASWRLVPRRYEFLSPRLYEFVVPMVPPSWNDRRTVEEQAIRLAVSSAPTCLSLSVLDICADDWHLAHFLLDGHHKMEAAAEHGRQLRLLSLISLDYSLAAREDILEVPVVLARPSKPS
ncbi:hypothetical protein ABZ471_47775 [Streptomyces sp. NPDC005728]|uniref:hypothetical protein n=1 Tax=Streptomyces sp. NPDC005728 TaxID=3157054 RepID=UPI0033EBF60C